MVYSFAKSQFFLLSILQLFPSTPEGKGLLKIIAKIPEIVLEQLHTECQSLSTNIDLDNGRNTKTNSLINLFEPEENLQIQPCSKISAIVFKKATYQSSDS